MPRLQPFAAAFVTLAACGPEPGPTSGLKDPAVLAQIEEAKAHVAGLAEDRRAEREDAMVTLPPSTIETVEVPRGVTRRRPVPGVAVAHRCRRPGTNRAASVALLQSSGDRAADEALLRRPVTRPADEAPAGLDRCVLVVDLDPATDPDPDAAVIPPVRLHEHWQSGDRSVLPSDSVRMQIARAGQRRLVVPIMLCTDRRGHVADVRLLQSSGYLAYDLDFINALAAWRYEPVQVDGVARNVCSVVSFIYNQVGEEVGGPMKFDRNPDGH